MKLAVEKLINFDNEKIDVENKKVVVYFYPKDNTPGCTIEANGFTKLIDDFYENNTVVIGVSNDSCASHQRFISKHNLKLFLISSENSDLIDDFDVMKEKNMFGKKFMGLTRSTFVFDANHELVKTYEKVKPGEHPEEVLAFIKTI